MEPHALPPSPREHPPPFPYPSPRSSKVGPVSYRGGGGNASKSLDAKALRDLPAVDFNDRGRVRGSVDVASSDPAPFASSSAYFDVLDAAVRKSRDERVPRYAHVVSDSRASTLDERDDLKSTRDGGGAAAAGRRRVHATATLAAAASSSAPRDQDGAIVGEDGAPLEMDARTADVLAMQQTQLVELNAQLVALRSQMSHMKSDGGDKLGGDKLGGGASGIENRPKSMFKRVDVRASRNGSTRSSSSSMRGGDAGVRIGDDSASRYPFGGAPPPTRVDVDVDVDVGGRRVADACTNTMWAKPAPLEPGTKGGEDHAAGTNDANDASAWTYEGKGRKSRGCATDPWVVSESGDAVAASRASPRRRGAGILRRSRVGGASGGDKSETRDAPPPLPPTEKAKAPAASDNEPSSSDKVSGNIPAGGGAGEGEGGGGGEGPALPAGGVLIPSSTSAFVRVGVDPGVDATSSDAPAPNSARSSQEVGAQRASRKDIARWSVNSDASSVSSLAALAAAEAAGAREGPGRDRDAGAAAPESPKPAFARFPLFADGDASPEERSPASENDEKGEGGEDEEDADARASRDSFQSYSLRGNLNRRDVDPDAPPADSDDDDAADYDDDDDDDDAGTTVTGTTSMIGDRDWAPPGRWKTQKMDVGVCYADDADEDDEDDGASDASSARSVPKIKGKVIGKKAVTWDEKAPRVKVVEKEYDDDDLKTHALKSDGLATITYVPLSDDESSDDEEMRALYRKYLGNGKALEALGAES